MISLYASQKQFWAHESESYVFFLKDSFIAETNSLLDPIEKDYYPHLKQLLKQQGFVGKRGQSYILTAMHAEKLVQFIFIGIGSSSQSWDKELDFLRRGISIAVSLLKKSDSKSAIFALPSATQYNLKTADLLKQVGVALYMASYEFTIFKSDKKSQPWTSAITFTIDQNDDLAHCTTSLSEAAIIGLAINNARTWADLPANIMTPAALAAEAKKVAEKYQLPLTIFGRTKALELGMGGFCAVDEGSEKDGQFIILEYKAATPNAPTIALCGKGVIFDTGGINLKPTSGIEGMKYDMSGAAAVIALMDIFAQLKPVVNIVCIAPCVENMPSGKAARPDDIITCMNGKTVEIKNTDAEGRLILSDALCYAEKFYNPAIIIDIATLTGAVQHALGHFYTGLMTKDAELAQMLTQSGKLTGDRVWELPLDDDFNEAIKSEVADIHNNGSSRYYAGTIVGGIFLSNFVSKSRWVHLDIAGTAHDVTGINYVGKGATGASIRLLTEFIMNNK